MTYDHYLANLAGEKPPIREAEPQPGYYKRKAGRKGPFLAAAIWLQGDDLLCRVGDEMCDPHKEWLWLARHPVAEADARHWFEHHAWPGEAVAVPPVDRPNSDAAPAATSDGHARPNGPADQHAAWTDRVQTLVLSARDWLAKTKIDSEATAKVAANKIGDLRSLASEGDRAHKTEKAPHLEAGREVDKRWLPLIKELDNVTAALRMATEDFARAERARLDAEARRAENARRQAEEDAVRGTAPPPPPNPAPLATSVKITSETGKALSLRTRRIPVVTSHKLALKHFANHPDVQAVVVKLAAAMKQGEVIPGCEWREDSYVA